MFWAYSSTKAKVNKILSENGMDASKEKKKFYLSNASRHKASFNKSEPSIGTVWSFFKKKLLRRKPKTKTS